MSHDILLILSPKYTLNVFLLKERETEIKGVVDQRGRFDTKTYVTTFLKLDSSRH